MREIAVLTGVSMVTVYGWMRRGLLKFRVATQSGYSIRRVVFAVDYLAFRLEKYKEPADLVPGSTGYRAWHWLQSSSHKAGVASAIARRAKLKAQSSSNTDPTS